MERINLKEKEVFKKEGRGMANVVDEPYLLINSRMLLKSMEGTDRYSAVVEHESKETFMAMHLSDDRQALFKKVETLIDGTPEPHFYEVVATRRK